MVHAADAGSQLANAYTVQRYPLILHHGSVRHSVSTRESGNQGDGCQAQADNGSQAEPMTGQQAILGGIFGGILESSNRETVAAQGLRRSIQ